MNRLKLFATATLMALTFTACDEGAPPPVEPEPPPPAVGTISGVVTIEGNGVTGITATLSSGATTATGSGGNFSFAGVEEGSYTVTISGFAEDATFPSVTQSATIATDGQNVQLNFPGQYIRSSAVVGSVVASDAMMSGSGDGQPETLAGVTVTLLGDHAMADPQQTDTETGSFSFSGLRSGSYTVEISGFPEDISFEAVSMTVEVDVGDVGTVDFEGYYIRTSAIEGQVIIEGEGLQGVTVTLAGGPSNDNYTKMTGADGEYAFTELRPGDYMVSLSGYDPADYEFAANSQDVSVGLDETETVSFTGMLLRTSGISGRVSVEGMGLGDIAVTLSGGDDRSTITDAGGQYAFAGLAAGDYTVSIAVESAAYVFESMSSDVSVADETTEIVNFEGAHATTASVSGMLFVDEAMKNDMHDEGEHPLAHAGVPVALVGPGVNDQRLSATNADGQFMFSGLRAGPYQLVVPITAEVAAALAAADLAYGGPATGYPFALAVGEAKTQAIPFDITHTTVNFTVSLKSGEEMGDALPGATVTLYSDAAGTTKVGGDETDENGMVAIRVARAGTSGNMVHAGVSADGYSVADGMTAVPWNPQYNMTAGANGNDIVNLNVDATVSGATVTTEYGGGDALAGWAISVMSGEDAVGGAPEALDEDGMAAFTTTVESVPATFSFAVVEDQDDAMDGGEAFEGNTVEYTHDGLSLAGTMDAGMIVVAYTTQTLKVYVHEELDQVMGYTGNVLGGDKRDEAGNVAVELRYIDDSGRSRSFTNAMWNAGDNTGTSKGVHTFSHVPADANVIVQADEDVEGVMLLEPDELATFRNMEDNGVTGGAFGAMGGFSHTVSLCPLQATSPQDHDECASFAYVNTHAVSGLVWKMGVTVDPESAGFKEVDPTFVPGITVTLSPVDGKNLAGDEESYTSAEEDDDDTEDIDETHMFDFSSIASGAYDLSVPSGWRAMMGGKGAEDALGNALNPLGTDVEIDVTPATGLVYGSVTDGEGFAAADVTVTANNQSAVTDSEGRYIIEGISPAARTISGARVTNSIWVETAEEGQGKTSDRLDFMANSPQMQDIDLSGVGQTASVSGTVRASGSNAPVAGVEITVDDEAPQNKATRGANAGKLVTGADGTYTAVFAAKPIGQSATVRASKDGMKFVPAELAAPAHAGSEISGLDFVGFVNATISGRVRGPDGRAMSDVTVTATAAGAAEGTAATDESTTRSTGTFSLNVPFGSYDIAASTDEAGISFSIPTASQTVSVAPGQSVDVGTIEALSPNARNVTAVRERAVDDDSTDDVDESETTWGTTILVTYTANADDVPAGYNEATYQIQHDVTDDASGWADATDVQQVNDDQDTPQPIPGRFTFTSPAASAFMVRVVVTVEDDDTADPDQDDLTLESGEATVAGIDPSASGVSAVRVATADTTVVDSLQVSWNAVTDADSDFRIVVQAAPASLDGASVWLVVDGGSTLTSSSRSWGLEFAHDFTSSTWDVAAEGGQENVTVTRADLDKALMIRVDSRQGDDDDWKVGGADDVAAAGG